MVPLIEFIHVLCGVTFFGAIFASFVYIVSCLRQQDAALLHCALSTSLLADCFVFPMILIQLLSGTFMVYHTHLPLNTPWIIVAYCVFGLVSLLWFMTALIKYVNYRSISPANFRYKKIFVFLNIVIILFFCMIIHDAVTQQTWLWR